MTTMHRGEFLFVVTCGVGAGLAVASDATQGQPLDAGARRRGSRVCGGRRG
jgi:hypothetical protein